MHQAAADTPAARNTILALALLLACLVLGGGETANPATELPLELVLPLLVVGAIWWPAHGRFGLNRLASRLAPGLAGGGALPVPRAAIAIAALVVVIPVAQLIPLPPAIWHALPGRQSEVAVMTLIDQAGRWMPFTLTPAATFASLLAVVAELGVFLCLARLDLAARRAVCWVIVAVTVTSILVGCLQISQAGGVTWTIDGLPNSGWVQGFQANRNAETDVLQVGVMALAAIIAGMAQQRDHLRASTLAVLVMVMLALALGAVLTGSRTGTALLPLTYLFVVWTLWPMITRRLAGIRRGTLLSWGVVLIPPVVCLLLARTEQVQHVLDRFGQNDDRRWDIWHTTLTAAGSVWPLGGGIGSFPVLYDASQSIERLSALIETRADNDWLEWVLEAGVPGIIALTLTALIVLVCNIRALARALQRKAATGVRKGSASADADYRATVIFATGTLLHIGLHALFDYPIRSMALAALVGAAAAMLMPLRNTTHAPE